MSETINATLGKGWPFQAGSTFRAAQYKQVWMTGACAIILALGAFCTLVIGETAVRAGEREECQRALKPAGLHTTGLFGCCDAA